jgi:hypothetical protein
VIEVGMRQDDGIKTIGWNLELAIFAVSLGATSLEGSAIDEYQAPVNLKDVFGAGNFFRGAK